MQLTTVLLFLAYTETRPDTVIESSFVGIARINAALLYKNIKLRLLRPSQKTPLLILEIIILLDKGKRKQNAPKIITLYKNHMCPTIYLILYFITIIFTDNAFYLKLINAGLSLRSLYNFLSPNGYIIINFTFKDDILKIPIF